MAFSSSASSLGQADIGQQLRPPPPVQSQHETDAANREYLPEGSSWRLLLERSSALARPIRGGNYVQLATVDCDGQPTCRTVVFRGFLPIHPDLMPVWDEARVACDDLPCIMAMTTDARSRKVEPPQQPAGTTAQESLFPAAELVWWFPNSNEQYRIAGELAFIGAPETSSGPVGERDEGANIQGRRALGRYPFLQQERVRMWGRLSESARDSFMTDAIPGRPYSAPTNEGSASGAAASGASERAQASGDPPASFLLMLLVPHSVDYLRLTNMYRQVDRIEGGMWTNLRVNP